MQSEVIYSGFEIHKAGIFPVDEKIYTIKGAKEPKTNLKKMSFV